MDKFDFVWVLIIAISIGFVVLKLSRLLYFKYLKLKRTRRLAKFTRHIRFWIVGFVSTLLAIPIIAYVFNFKSIPISGSADHWGQMGDFFGGMLNPVLAFASFMALLYTIRIQSAELRMTREELKLTRNELTKSSEANQKSSEAAESQLLLSKMQYEEKMFYNAVEKIKNDISNIYKSKFNVSYYYSGSRWKERSGYIRYSANDPGFCSIEFKDFIRFYLTSRGHFSLINAEGKINIYNFGLNIDNESFNYILLETSSSSDLKNLLLRHSFVFERLFFSLSYAINAIEQMELYYPPKKNFTLYYYSHLIDIITPDFLVLLAIFFNHQRVIDYDKLAKIKFFERLVIDKKGYIKEGLINVINDLNLPAESYGVNVGYQDAKKNKLEDCQGS